MAKKYYAVRAGRKTGIFETWDECRAQTTGFKGASFKSFPTLAEAKAYMRGENDPTKAAPAENTTAAPEEDGAVAYVDGSYHIGTKEFSCGAVLFLNGEELHFSERFTDPDLAEMRNVAGEIKGSETVLRYCIEHDVPSVTIYHDYEGVAKWATGEWKAKKPGTIAYREFCAAAAKHNVIVVSDEIHSDLIMPGHKHVAFANACKDALPKYLVCTAPSKTFNLATLQTSNIIIPDEELRTKFQSILQQHFTPSAGALGLEACRLGYTECEGWLAEVIDLIYKNYKNFCAFIDANCPGVTYSDLQGTYLMWIDCTTFGLDDEALDKLLRKHDLFCDAGTLFSQGGTMHTRVNLAGPEKMLNAAMQRFKDAYDEAKNA